MERLLRFSLEHDRIIRMMYMAEEHLVQVNARVVAYDEKEVSFITTRSPRTVVITRASLLSADFRRGDDGQVV